MTLISHDERLIKALAVAIVDRPRATLKELAEAAGVSKATCTASAVRETTWCRCSRTTETVLNQIIQACDLEHAEPLEALQRLIKEHLTHRELLVFLVFQYRPDFSTRTAKAHAGSPTWKRWTPSSCATAERRVSHRHHGGRVHRTVHHPGLRHGRCGTSRTGGQLNSAHTLEQMFLHGASNPARS